MAGNRLGADGQHLRPDLFEAGDVVGVGVQLLRAHGRVVARVEDHHDGLAEVVRQGVVPAPRAGQGEVRRSFPDADGHPRRLLRAVAVRALRHHVEPFATKWSPACHTGADQGRPPPSCRPFDKGRSAHASHDPGGRCRRAHAARHGARSSSSSPPPRRSSPRSRSPRPWRRPRRCPRCRARAAGPAHRATAAGHGPTPSSSASPSGGSSCSSVSDATSASP